MFCISFVVFGTGDKVVYTSEKTGDDGTGDGTEVNPYKTVIQALRSTGKEPWPTIYVDAKEDGKVFQLELRIYL